MAQGAILIERITFDLNIFKWKLIYEASFLAFCFLQACWWETPLGRRLKVEIVRKIIYFQMIEFGFLMYIQTQR